MSNISDLLIEINIIFNRKKVLYDLINLLNPKSRYIVEQGIILSQNAVSVLESAFSEKYDHHSSYANAYDLAEGSKGMDWWNFPWDLPSSQMQYTITYKDMKEILKYVLVKMKINDTTYVRYSAKLSNMISQLNSKIMNSHGGALRVIKIIYCVRNFLSVALKYNLKEDIDNLKQAANKLLSINKNELLDTNTYNKSSTYKPKNINGILEDRTRDNGLADLQNMIK